MKSKVKYINIGYIYLYFYLIHIYLSERDIETMYIVQPQRTYATYIYTIVPIDVTGG